MTFVSIFFLLTGYHPLPWQIAFYNALISGKDLRSVRVPTGTGKTLIIAIWLIALALHPEQTPRRLVYIVNRRTVVDQTSLEATRLREALTKPDLAEIRTRLAALCALPLPTPDAPPLAISTLRGQFADNGEWCADPARPAIIIGTVDMIGSGILFNRFTKSFKIRPLHAGLLAQDALLVHDEAHLEPAFQSLLERIVGEQTNDGDSRPLRVIELTATSRSEEKDPAATLTLSEADFENVVVKKRVHATKQLSLVPLAEGEKLEEKLLQTIDALAKKKSGDRAILVFVRTVETVTKIIDALDKGPRKGKVAALTGTIRGKERDRLASENLVFQRFLHPKDRSKTIKPTDGTVYLVATSAGEIGVNLSADDLVCDLSTFESMAQRFGRVNRFGDNDDSEVIVVHESAFDAAKPLEAARERTLALLQKLNGTANSIALDKLSPSERAAAFSPAPEQRIATAVQFDAWALTSIREPIAARPPVTPYLHGEAEWQPPETHIAWREELDILKDKTLSSTYPFEDLLEAFPLRPHELLRDTTSRIVKILGELHKKNPDAKSIFLSARILDANGSLQEFHPFRSGEFDKETAESQLADVTLILPASFGGISTQGFFSSAETSAKNCDISEIENVRLRVWQESPEIPEEYKHDYRIVRLIDTQLGREDDDSDEEIAEADLQPETSEETTGGKPRYWIWLAAKNSFGIEQRFSRNQHPETLAAHTAAVTANAEAIAEKVLQPPAKETDPNFRRCLSLAAVLHDLGKDRDQWQRNIGNNAYDPQSPETILAKSGGKNTPRNIREYYRHEFGSLHDASAFSDLHTLSDLERDIVLHLIAAHHGRARPHFSSEEIFDYAASDTDAIATETPRRFARLQRHFGRWGLAWLESLLRAADYAASAGIVSPKTTPPFPLKGASPKTIPAAPTPLADITLRLNPANPAHYFSCCGLFEVATILTPDVHAWFSKDGSTFHIAAAALSVKELLSKLTSAEISALDPNNRPLTPLQISFKGNAHELRPLRIDWWRHENSLIGKLKPWAGQMSVRDITDDMRKTLKRELKLHTPEFLEKVFFLSSISNNGEPFYFDANRALNAKAQDVGFSLDKLKKGGIKITPIATPAIELLCLIGLQRARPVLAVNERGKEREYDYHLWSNPLPLSLLAAAVIGILPDSIHRFRFSNPSRAKDYRAFAPASHIS